MSCVLTSHLQAYECIFVKSYIYISPPKPHEIIDGAFWRCLDLGYVTLELSVGCWDERCVTIKGVQVGLPYSVLMQGALP